METAAAVGGESNAVIRGGARGAATWYAYLLLGYFTYMMSIQGNVLPFLKAELGLSYRLVSLHTSMIAVGMILLGFIAERVTRRFGRGIAMRMGVVGSVIAIFLICLSPAAWASLASCALFGFFGGLIPMIVNTSLSDLYGARREIAFSEANAVAYAFALIAPILSGAVAWLGLSWRLGILAAAAAGMAIILLFRNARLPEVDRHAVRGGGVLPPAFWFLACSIAFAAALEFSVLLWAPTYLERIVGMTPSGAAVAAAAFFLAMLVGRVLSSWLIHFVAARTLFLACCAMTFVGFAAYWGTTVPAVVVAGLFGVGLGISVAFPLLLGFAMGAAPDAGDRASPRIMVLCALAILVGPPLLGSLADTIGLALAQLMTPVVALLMLGGFLTGEMLQRRRLAVRPASSVG